MPHGGLRYSNDEDPLKRRRDSRKENKSSEEQELEHRRKVGEFSKHLKREDLRSLDKYGIDSDRRIETRSRSEGADTRNRRQRVIDEFGLITSVREYMPGKIFTEGNLPKPQQWQEAAEITQRTMQLIRNCKLQNEDPTKLIEAGKKLDFYLQKALQGQGVPMKHYQEAYEELKKLNDKVAETLHSNDSSVDLTFDKEHASEEGPDNLTHASGHRLASLPNDSGVHLPLDDKPLSEEEQFLHNLAYQRLKGKFNKLERMYEKSDALEGRFGLKKLNNKLQGRLKEDLKKAEDAPEGKKKQQKIVSMFNEILDKLLNWMLQVSDEEDSNSKEKVLEESLPMRKAFHNGADFPTNGETPGEPTYNIPQGGGQGSILEELLKNADQKVDGGQGPKS